MVGPDKSGTISATGTTYLGEAASSRVSSWAIQFESSSFSGSVTVKARVAGVATDYTLQALAYKDQTTGTNSTSAITGSGLILADGAGLDVALDCTSYTSGTLKWTAKPLVG